MELVTTIQSTVQARATMDEEGTLRVVLIGSATYREVKEGEGDEAKTVPLSVGVTKEVTDPALVDPFKAAMQALLEAAPKLLGPSVATEVHKARSIAQSLREMEV